MNEDAPQKSSGLGTEDVEPGKKPSQGGRVVNTVEREGVQRVEHRTSLHSLCGKFEEALADVGDARPDGSLVSCRCPDTFQSEHHA